MCMKWTKLQYLVLWWHSFLVPVSLWKISSASLVICASTSCSSLFFFSLDQFCLNLDFVAELETQIFHVPPGLSGIKMKCYSLIVTYNRTAKNPRHQVAWVTKVWMAVPNICRYAVWNLLLVPQLVPWTLRNDVPGTIRHSLNQLFSVTRRNER